MFFGKISKTSKYFFINLYFYFFLFLLFAGHIGPSRGRVFETPVIDQSFTKWRIFSGVYEVLKIKQHTVKELKTNLNF
jgi:hypothetical protein